MLRTCLALPAVLAAVLGASLAFAAPARAESCAYNAATKAVTAAIDAGGEATLKVRGTGEIAFGAIPADCGAATSTNTDSVTVTGASGSAERLVVDLGEHPFGPGAATEFNTPEIEISAALGDTTDTVAVRGTAGSDSFAAGQLGVALNNDGDPDVVPAPGNMRLEVTALGGSDTVTGRGTLGTGQPYLGVMSIDGGEGDDPLLRGSGGDDVVSGGPGLDAVEGHDGNDIVDGGPGADATTGGAGNDSVSGGSGIDTLNGGADNDTLFAADGEADTQINGGPGVDVAYYDAGLDANPAAVESKFSACVFDPLAKTITAIVPPGGEATLKVSSTGMITFGLTPTLCGTATATNTDTITITGTAGSSEKLVLDLREHVLGPGATPEFNIPEIELETALGDASDTVVIYGTPGDDFFAAGQNGIALYGDGDVDATFAPGAFNLEVYALGGSDFVDARGTAGAGLHFLGPVVIDGGEGDDIRLRGSSEADHILGGPGNDDIEGLDSDDVVDAGPGDDRIAGGGGDDQLTGGTGRDDLIGSEGDDVLDAADGEADLAISGGAGTDTAYYDVGVDPLPIAVENPIGGGGGGNPPPPPPSGPCAYDAVTKKLVAQVPAGGAATLKVVDGAITLSTPEPQDCGGATTTNTESIALQGSAGTVEQLTIDASGGAFAPGITPESGNGALDEIELTATLGDASDTVLVIGTPGADSIFVGSKGVALNGDADADLTFDVLPAAFELRGGGGANTLSGKGGAGSGSPFAGAATLVAGDGGDALTGGLGNDVLVGGAGADTLEGREGDDTVTGGGGDDGVFGNEGNDTLTGGAGLDTIAGSDGEDLIRADDGEADPTISGGSGVDTAYYDAVLDPLPAAVENRIPV